MKVAFCTLGCKVNSYDSSMMAQILKDKGCEIVDFDSMADVYIINSCTVTGTGDKKSRQMASKARQKNPNAVVCMTGCYSQVAPKEVEKLGVDLIIGTSGRSNIYELINKAKNERTFAVYDDLTEFEDCFTTLQDERTRAFVKIQDGCDRFCTYCIIPYARGKSRSRNIDSIVNEVIDLTEKDYKEIVLTGIHIASYGKDINSNLLEVIKKVNEIDKVKRIRLGSIEPLILTQDFCDELSKIDKLCHSFHVSMQSGCDRTLKRMGRRYDSKQYKECIDNLRRVFKDCSITTDIIVGFPDETDEDFEICLNFVKEIKFARCHIFPYSKRENTPAAKMDNQIEKATKTLRAKKMSEVCSKNEKEYIASYIGKTKSVLFEQEVEKNLFAGYTDNYIRVFVKGQNLYNKIADVKLKETYRDGLIGEI